jgi:hypothetical protein
VKISSSVRGSGALMTSGKALFGMTIPPGAIRIAYFCFALVVIPKPHHTLGRHALDG